MSGGNDKLKILLVEDCDDDAFFFGRALDKTLLPCEFVHVADGGAAVEHLRNARGTGSVPDLIFLDLKLPVLSGFEVLRWLGTQNFQPFPNAAVLSGSDHEGDLVMARSPGASDYFVKPIKPEQLQVRLAGLLRPSNPGEEQVEISGATKARPN
jgi:two-component system response regulator